MKRIIILVTVIVLVISGTIVWLSGSNEELFSKELIQAFVIILIVSFAVILGYKRVRSYRRGEPQEDELSRKILTKAASVSYYVSIYLWLALMYFSDRSKIETHSFIGAGILGMAVIFAISWLVIYLRGIKNE